MRHRNILFITGTDTGVGKTVLTALLLAHLRSRGVNALAIKPFCSGGRADVRLLQSLQDHALPDELVNPWFFDAPIAPALAGARKRNKPNKIAVLAHIRAVAKQGDVLLVEGAGGLLSPLAADLTALDLIRELKCPVLVAARNRLGCLNHVLLTGFALKKAGVREKKVVLMDVARPDFSARTNASYLRKKPDFIGVFRIPWLGREAGGAEGLKKNAKKMKKTLARCADFDNFRPALWKTTVKAAEKKVEKT